MAIERAASRYSLRANFRLPGGSDSAQIIGQEIEALAKEQGGVTASALLERADTVGTALHEWDARVGYFERDDARAAQSHREAQARFLIRAVAIHVQSGEESLSTRAFFVMNDHAGVKAYQPIDTIALNAEASAEIIDRFRREIVRLDQHYRAYLAYVNFAQEFDSVFRATEAVVDKAANMGDQSAKRAQSQRYRLTGGRVALAST